MIRSVLRRLRQLKDVDSTGLADGDSLIWNASTSKYEPGAGGGSPLTVNSVVKDMNGWLYSHSYGTIVGSGPTGSSSSVWPGRVARRLLMNGFTSRSTAGFEALDILDAAAVGANILVPGSAGVLAFDGILNDVFQDGSTAAGRLGFENALRAFLWIAYCNARTEITSTGVFDVGGATETAAAEYSGGSAVYSDSNGAVASFNVTGTDVVLFLGGRKDGVSAVNGGTAEVRVDGTLVATQALGNQYRQSGASGTKYRGPIAVPLLGMASGTHAVTVTNIGVNGTRLVIDCWATVNTRAPETILIQQPYVSPVISSYSDAAVDDYNAIVADVADEFILLGKPIHVIDMEVDWDINTMQSSVQARHPNDLGNEHYASKVTEVLAAITTARIGLNAL